MASSLKTVCIAISLFSVKAASELARGWGDDIEWVTLETAWNKSKQEKKVVMLVVHKTWCGACKALRPKFAESKEIKRLSKNFIMVNTQDDEEPTDAKYRPDGGYIPRIMFYNYKGKLLEEFYNKQGSAKYKFYYSSPDGILESMRAVLKDLDSINKKTEL